MNQIVAIAVGGAFGAVLRYLVSSGVYQWFGRGFPYGTLAVNVIGSLLIGLLTEALVLQRMEITSEYRAAILVGLFGSFTTFSTFSLETLYLLEQGNYLKSALNILISVIACLAAAWIGLLLGRTLFTLSGGVVRWFGWVFPYAIVLVNFIGSLLIGLLTQSLVHRVSLTMEYRAAILITLVGVFTTLSTLYLILYLIEEGHSFKDNLGGLLTVFIGNASVCLFAVWLGLLTGKQF